MKPVRLPIMAAIAAALLLLVPSALPAADDTPPARIVRIAIQGNRFVETATIRSRMATAEGSLFDPDKVSDDIRSLYAMGYFDDIQVAAEGFEGGLALTFTLREKPVIARIDFRGNDAVKTDDLRAQIDLKTNTMVDEYSIKVNIERLRAYLSTKGYYRASVDYRFERVDENEQAVVFLITEGEKIRVGTISVEGNTQVDDDEIIGVMKTETKGIFSFLTGSGILVSQQLEEDAGRIRSHLANQGFVKARVEPPTVKIDEAAGSIAITVTVHEGIRYKTGTVEIFSDDVLTEADIRAVVRTETGQVLTRDGINRDVAQVTALYAERGFAFARADMLYGFDDAAAVVNLRLVVDHGPRVRVGRITIFGNTITRDNVVRREILLREGEFFSSKLLSRSRQRLMNLGFFDKVDITHERRGEDLVDINVTISERLTGMVQVGLGYSSETKIGGVFKITQDNLFGWGHKLQGSLDYAQARKEYSITYDNRAVFDSGFNAGFKLYDLTNDYDEYDKKTQGGALTIGHSLWEFMRASITYSNTTDEVTNVADDASDIIKAEEGINDTRSLTTVLSRNSKNDYFTPSSGSLTELRFEYAGGFLGGENYYTRWEAEHTQFVPLFWEFVFSLHGEYGQIDGFDGREVPIYKRFFMGGVTSVRGFRNRSLGPRDENDDNTGGFTKVLFNAEIVFPLIKEQRLMGVLFYDSGQVFGLDEDVDLGLLRSSVGAEVRWFSPMGPLRFVWGYPLEQEPGDERNVFDFTIGTMF
jgi:outer membrane protein insertion porin family